LQQRGSGRADPPAPAEDPQRRDVSVVGGGRGSPRAAFSETRDRVEAPISTVNADARRRRAEASERVAEAKDDAGVEWSRLRTNVSGHVDGVRAKVDQGRDEHDANGAARRADHAEQNTVDSIDCAISAVLVEEATVLGAAAARMIADSMA
jgi:hypothetical protein